MNRHSLQLLFHHVLAHNGCTRFVVRSWYGHLKNGSNGCALSWRWEPARDSVDYTDRRGEVCGNQRAMVVRPLDRGGSVWRKFLLSPWFQWVWHTPARVTWLTGTSAQRARTCLPQPY